MCLRLITLVHTYVFFCASWSWFLDMQFFWPTFLVACHLTLICIRGDLLLFLILLWFDGVSYVFSICSYVLGRCNGWVPMHFSELGHLPYRHSFFIPTLVAAFHVRLINSSSFDVSCHLYLQVQLLAFVYLLIWVVSSKSTHANYSLLYLIKFYFSGGSLDHQLLLIEIYIFYMLHWCSTWSSFLFISSETFSSLEASAFLH